MPIRERRCATLGLALAAVLFLLPLLLVRAGPVPLEDEALLPPATLPIDRTPAAITASRDSGRPVRLQRADGTVEEMTMDAYLWGVVAAEMPASFEEEALKAQACAARTYAAGLQARGSKHPDADLCDDSRCCQAYTDRDDALLRWGLSAQLYADKITNAVEGTDGLGVLYQGSPIQAVFFSSAAGKTADAVEVWGSSVDYLKSVDSPEGAEVPNYHSQVVLAPDDLKAQALAVWPGADFSGGPETWLQDVSYTASGVVSGLKLGGVSVSGGEVRNAFALRSACFQVKWDGEHFVFDVTGYGHGVGMSQYGANAMAKEGRGFRDILTWYYTGTEVDYLW